MHTWRKNISFGDLAASGAVPVSFVSLCPQTFTSSLVIADRIIFTAPVCSLPPSFFHVSLFITAIRVQACCWLCLWVTLTEVCYPGWGFILWSLFFLISLQSCRTWLFFSRARCEDRASACCSSPRTDSTSTTLINKCESVRGERPKAERQRMISAWEHTRIHESTGKLMRK